MYLSTDTQTWPEVTGDTIGKVRKLAWTQCIKVKDIYSDMARQHGRHNLQAPTHALKVNDLIKGQQLKFI